MLQINVELQQVSGGTASRRLSALTLNRDRRYPRQSRRL